MNILNEFANGLQVIQSAPKQARRRTFSLAVKISIFSLIAACAITVFVAIACQRTDAQSFVLLLLFLAYFLGVGLPVLTALFLRNREIAER